MNAEIGMYVIYFLFPYRMFSNYPIKISLFAGSASGSQEEFPIALDDEYISKDNIIKI
jgi:hypothetical protein